MGIPMTNVTEPSDFDELKNIVFTTELDTTKKWQAYHCQNIMTFDIETSSGYRNQEGIALMYDYDNHESFADKEPMSVMYVWQFGIETQDGIKVFMGRTWDELEEFIVLLSDEIQWSAVNPGCSADSKYRETEIMTSMAFVKPTVNAYIYSHNLGFEYQHLRNIFEKLMEKGTFARSMRKPMKSSFRRKKVKMNFKDSLHLTNKSLNNWSKDSNLAVKKLEEPADYYIPIRTPKTPLTQDEIMYSINDVVSMIYGLEIYRDKYGKIQNIPLTQTGQVRLLCIERVTKVNTEWAEHCTQLTKNYTLDMFNHLIERFSGGWVNANPTTVGRTLKNVTGYDLASSYPSVMTTKTFPIGEFEQVHTSMFDQLEAQDLDSLDLRHHYMFTVKLRDVSTKKQNNYWSVSKVRNIKGQMVANGRVVYADEMEVAMTDLDWRTFKQAYSFSEYEITELFISEAGFLATELIETILDYYQDKTLLKGTDRHSEYDESKQFINSIYGVAVTKIAADEIVFDGEWSKKPLDAEMFYDIMESTNAESTFLAYQFGIWITAWARQNLWQAIIELDNHVAYGDTDSVKGQLTDEDIKWFDVYNAKIEAEQMAVASRLEIDPNRYAPKDLEGNVKRLGIWEFDGFHPEFKTLGAKRYCASTVDGDIEVTVSGLPKSAGELKIKKVDDFHNGVVWDSSESGKLISYYNDDQKETTWIDRNGESYVSNDKYGQALKPTTFDLSITDEFEQFLEFVIEGVAPEGRKEIPALFMDMRM